MTNTAAATKTPPSMMGNFTKKFSFLCGYCLIVLFFWLFISPNALQIEALDPRFVRTSILLSIPLLILTQVSVLGFWKSVGWYLGFFWFPIGLMFSATINSYKTIKRIYATYNRFYIKTTILFSAVAAITLGLVSQNKEILNILAVISFVGILHVIISVTKKAFNPLGPINSVVKALAGFDKNIILGMVSNLIKKTDDKGNPQANNLDLLRKTLDITTKVPKFIENPKIPLVLFLASFLPAVFLIFGLFAIIYKAWTPTPLTNGDYLLMSVYQFTGSDFHGLAEPDLSLRWVLAAQSFVAYYFSVIIILAFGITAQIQSSTLGKQLRESIGRQLKETAGIIPQQIKETHTESERTQIVAVLQQPSNDLIES